MSDATTYGPNSIEVQAFLDKLPGVTREQYRVAKETEATTNHVAWGVAVDVAWKAAMSAGLVQAFNVLWDVPDVSENDIKHDAAVALLTRHLIPSETFETLVAPWRAIGFTFEDTQTTDQDKEPNA